jgi:CheY-like chemotaxis protein
MQKFNIIWLIDDDEIFCFSVERIIEISNFSKEVRCFPNGLVALDAIRELETNFGKMPDIIFLDVNMPILDGWQFLDNIKNCPIAEHLNIYMLSSSIDSIDLQRANEYHMVRKYIAKPISVKILQELY